MFDFVVRRYNLIFFEIQKEDEFRKPGFSKERRLEPQIIVGLLVDETGFPLMVHSFEGNKAETLTFVPVIKKFVETIKLDKVTIVADAAMFSEKNLEAIEDLGFDFIVASRVAKTPYKIAEYKDGHPGEKIPDQKIFVQTKEMGASNNRRTRTVIYQYREDRARLDFRNIDKQVSKASKVITGKLPVTRTRFVKISGTKAKIDDELIASAKSRAGIKGYVTNLQNPNPKTVIEAYHQLFEVERSFRMSKHDLKARPIFHQIGDSINAHLTIVFASLAISRIVQKQTQMSISRYVKLLRPIRSATVEISGQTITIQPRIPEAILKLKRGD